MAEGSGATTVKMQVDYRCEKHLDKQNNYQELKYLNLSCLSSTCDEKLLVGGGSGAAHLLSGLEKQTRTGCDTYSTARVLVTIVQLCYYAGDFTQLDDRIQDLAKQAVAKMIAECQNNIA